MIQQVTPLLWNMDPPLSTEIPSTRVLTGDPVGVGPDGATRALPAPSAILPCPRRPEPRDGRDPCNIVAHASRASWIPACVNSRPFAPGGCSAPGAFVSHAQGQVTMHVFRVVRFCESSASNAMRVSQELLVRTPMVGWC